VRAIRITEFGGPEVLHLVDDQPDPRPSRDGGARRHHAGVNYADTHQAEDSYLAPSELPLVPGAEAVGTLPDGRRVVALLAAAGTPNGPSRRTRPAFEVPDAVDDGQALALVLQGTTAWHLLRTSAQLREGESVVVHAAAGGVGTLAVQLAKRWGAGRVIAVASSEEKRQLALDLGADVAIDAAEEDLKERARGGERRQGRRRPRDGRRATTDQSLAALAPFGRLVVFGMASREAGPAKVDLGELMGRSRGVIGFWLVHAWPTRRATSPPDARAARPDRRRRPAPGRRRDLRAVGRGAGPHRPPRAAHRRQARPGPGAVTSVDSDSSIDS
jgi:NADPH:quinone reductase